MTIATASGGSIRKGMSSSFHLEVISVRTKPGHTVTTFTPVPRRSTRRDSIIAMTAALLEL